MGNEFMSTQEVMDFLGIARSTLYKYIDENKLDVYKPKTGGRKSFFKRNQVEGLLGFEMREDEIPDPSVEELEEAALAFQEAAAERAAGTLSTSADIRRMAADVLAARRAGFERATA
jgi:excisionase family DNA binding protein